MARRNRQRAASEIVQALGRMLATGSPAANDHADPADEHVPAQRALIGKIVSLDLMYQERQLRMLNGALDSREHGRADVGMEHGGRGDAAQVEVPQLVGMIVADARQAGHEAGLVVISADPDGPPISGLTWPGIWIVTAQHPVPGTWSPRGTTW